MVSLCCTCKGLVFNFHFTYFDVYLIETWVQVHQTLICWPSTLTPHWTGGFIINDISTLYFTSWASFYITPTLCDFTDKHHRCESITDWSCFYGDNDVECVVMDTGTIHDEGMLGLATLIRSVYDSAGRGAAICENDTTVSGSVSVHWVDALLLLHWKYAINKSLKQKNLFFTVYQYFVDSIWKINVLFHP